MNPINATKRHGDVYLAGFRARAVAVGMVELIKELSQAGVLDQAAVDRIRDSVADELTVARPVGQPADEFRTGVVARLDGLLRPEQKRDATSDSTDLR